MPAATLTELGLEGKSPSDLETLRREIIAKLNTEYKGYDDPDVPMDLLNTLAVVTSSLRRKNAGPPKEPKKTKGPSVKAQTNDFVL